MSVVVVVTAFPAAGYRDKVVAAFEKAITRVHEEPGVEVYALHEGPDPGDDLRHRGRDRLVMIEKYESERARAEHAKRPALADLLADLDGKLTSKLDVQVLTPHPFGDPDKGTI